MTKQEIANTEAAETIKMKAVADLQRNDVAPLRRGDIDRKLTARFCADVANQTCPCCGCPMSLINPKTCQNCDYQTDWSQNRITRYKEELSRVVTDENCEDFYGDSDL